MRLVFLINNFCYSSAELNITLSERDSRNTLGFTTLEPNEF